MMQKAQPQRIVFLACPYGEIGGGMGSIMAYLAALGIDSSGQFRLSPLETRGGGRIIFSPFFLFIAICRILFETICGRLALVHVNLADGGSVYRKALLILAAKAVGTPVLLHIHAGRIIPFYNSRGWFGKALLGVAVRTADHCIVLGSLWRDWLTDILGVPRRFISIIPNGVPATPHPRKPRTEGQPFRVIFVGNLLPDKGVADLLAAFARPELQGAVVTLTLAGGGDVARYQMIANELGLGSRVRFTGWIGQSAVRELLAESDALVLPSYHEALPLVVLEALASQVPVICTPVGAIPDMLPKGKVALFVRPGDPDGLAATILRLSGSTILQERLSREGFALYRRSFTMEAFTERLSELYLQLARPLRSRAGSASRTRPTAHFL